MLHPDVLRPVTMPSVVDCRSSEAAAHRQVASRLLTGLPGLHSRADLPLET